MLQLKHFGRRSLLELFAACVAVLFVLNPVSVSGMIANQHYRNCVGVSLGPSYSSISVIERGARLFPLDGDGFTLLESNPTDTKGTSRTIEDTAFDTRNATCASNEPHHFVSRRMNTPCSKGHPARRPGFVDTESLPSLFAEMKEIAESWLQDDVEYAVVMVPDYYSREDYSDIKDAAKTVGLSVVLVKPHSAAVGTAYGVGWSQEDATVLFCDLGHETFQVSAYYADLGIFEHLSNTTDHQLAKRIYQALVKEHSKQPYLDAYQMELVEQTLPAVERVIAEANLSKSDFNHLVVSGIHTRHAQIRRLLEEFMGRRITPLGQDVELWRLWEPSNLDPDEVVTFGAATFAAALSKPLPASRFNYPF